MKPFLSGNNLKRVVIPKSVKTIHPNIEQVKEIVIKDGDKEERCNSYDECVSKINGR